MQIKLPNYQNSGEAMTPFLLAVRQIKTYISHEELERLNWLPVTYRFKQ